MCVYIYIYMYMYMYVYIYIYIYIYHIHKVRIRRAKVLALLSVVESSDTILTRLGSIPVIVDLLSKHQAGPPATRALAAHSGTRLISTPRDSRLRPFELKSMGGLN